MEKFGLGYMIGLVLDVAKWKPPNPEYLGFDAAIYAVETSARSAKIRVGGRAHRRPKRGSPILVGRFDHFQATGSDLILRMDGLFEELPTDAELEAQGFQRDRAREAEYPKD
jgi:hypothetical protein